ncbi:MAG: diacylglycerol/lipid kinase family protein [Oscillospiraceae bacterium]
MKHLFIVNPAAGGKDSTDYVSASVAKAFSGREGDFEIYTTKGPMDAAKKISYEADLCDELRVYACGGDGTLNECVCGAAGRPNVAVTHFPTGTGNDFIRTFGEEKQRFTHLEELIEGQVRPIDIMDCNGRKSINICSVGIDARIGTGVHQYSKLPFVGGAAGYVTSLVVNFCKGITQDMRVICNGKLYYGEMSLICACNGRYYGGGFNPVPEARPDNGKLEFLIVKGISRAAFLRLVGHYAKGEYANYPKYITHVTGESMEIESEEEIVVNVDGEALFAKKIRLQVIPGGVNFVFPANMAFFENKKEKIKAN